MTIERVGVVIPAHDEEALLPACLNSVMAAAAQVHLPVRVVVVLDRCTDQSRAIVRRHRSVQSIDVIAGNVGAARAAGVEALLQWAGSTHTDTIWLATTDADTTVPRAWIRRQVEYADRGWEAFAGTVTVDDWSEHPPHVQHLWGHSYRPVDGHHHVHGANFGCTAKAYLHAGGWAPLATDEDVALLAAMACRRVLRSAANPVTTSARRQARARGGFGDALRELAG